MTKVDEIERRFLTTSNEWRDTADEKRKLFIVQCYPDNLQRAGFFGRVRSTLKPDGGIKYERGDKEPAQGLKTPEDEWPVDELAFLQMKLAAEEKNLRKWRWPITFDEPQIMVDEFTHIRNSRTDLVITEVEFTGADAEERALAFTPSTWMGLEITGEHRWSNFSLCTQGVPAH